MPQPIQFRRSTVDANLAPDSADGTTAVLLAGEPAVTIGTQTRLWIGDGTANRMVLSTDPVNDNPRFTAAYLRLAGGQQLTGAVTTTQTTFANTELVTKTYVDQAVAAGNLQAGFWDVPGNDPDFSSITPPPNGTYWIVDVGGPAPTGIPGITPGLVFNPGDWIVWDANLTPTPGFRRIAAGGLTITDADARYLQLTGGAMSAPGTITMPTGYVAGTNNLELITKGYADGLVANRLTTVVADNVTIGGDGIATATALHVIKVDGGVFS